MITDSSDCPDSSSSSSSSDSGDSSSSDSSDSSSSSSSSDSGDSSSSDSPDSSSSSSSSDSGDSSSSDRSDSSSSSSSSDSGDSSSSDSPDSSSSSSSSDSSDSSSSDSSDSSSSDTSDSSSSDSSDSSSSDSSDSSSSDSSDSSSSDSSDSSSSDSSDSSSSDSSDSSSSDSSDSSSSDSSDSSSSDSSDSSSSDSSDSSSSSSGGISLEFNEFEVNNPHADDYSEDLDIGYTNASSDEVASVELTFPSAPTAPIKVTTVTDNTITLKAWELVNEDGLAKLAGKAKFIGKSGHIISELDIQGGVKQTLVRLSLGAIEDSDITLTIAIPVNAHFMTVGKGLGYDNEASATIGGTAELAVTTPAFNASFKTSAKSAITNMPSPNNKSIAFDATAALKINLMSETTSIGTFRATGEQKFVWKSDGSSQNFSSESRLSAEFESVELQYKKLNFKFMALFYLFSKQTGGSASSDIEGWGWGAGAVINW